MADELPPGNSLLVCFGDMSKVGTPTGLARLEVDNCGIKKGPPAHYAMGDLEAAVAVISAALESHAAAN